ncbi:hypothetical protein, partial [Actinobaculum suis]
MKAGNRGILSKTAPHPFSVLQPQLTSQRSSHLTQQLTQQFTSQHTRSQSLLFTRSDRSATAHPTA